ncbi:hypothetical protein KEJ15_04935 [Candidatus Bathyarchaeota archaeon]|nr:hypothetical protein [Candidatus Bathyarchaeota archaeon]
MRFVKAVLFCFLILASVLRMSVVAETVNTGIVGELAAAESFDRGIIVFSTYEFSVGVDLNGDSDTLDIVIRYYNVSSGITTNTTAVGENPTIGGSIIAFTTYEGYIGEDLNNDTDINDYILRYYDIASGTTVNTGEFGLEPVVDNGVVVFFVAEDWLDKDLNGDGNKVDRFVWYYNVFSKTIFNATAISGTYPSKCGDIITFVTWENWDNIDLNGDGDALDSVIRYYNVSEGTITNTEAVGHEPSIDGNVIAFYTDESDVSDLNGDGDTSDKIIRYYDISAGTVINTAAYGEFPCIEGNIIAFETWEPDFGEDANGDGDINDMVIRYYDISLGAIATTAETGFYAAVDGRRIAFGTYESYLDEDVNGDGDKSDIIIRYYTIPTIRQGNLVLEGNDICVIEGKFDINGSIIVTENATLILRNAVVNFTQTSNYQHNMTFRNPVDGNPRLQSENSVITSGYWFEVILYDNSSATFASSTDTAYLQVYGSATASISDSTIEFLAVGDSAVVSVVNSTISYALSAWGDTSVVSVSNSTVEFLATKAMSVNCTFANVVPGFLPFWNFHINSSMVIGTGGYAPNVTLVDTNVNGWQFEFQESSNATIIDSQLVYLHCYGYSNVWLVNTTAGLIQFTMDGIVYVSWYLDAHVVDSIGQDVPSANVNATYTNATIAESELTDIGGWARLTLMEKMMNASGSYPLGNYTVSVTYTTHSTNATIEMTENKQITLMLEDFVVSEFPAFIILPLFMMATLVLVFIFGKKHSLSKSANS